LMPTYGEETEFKSGMALPSSTFVMRRGVGKWFVAGFNGDIIRPGWPPTLEPIPRDDVTFGTGEPPTDAGG
jgi:hypothetical protein